MQCLMEIWKAYSWPLSLFTLVHKLELSKISLLCKSHWLCVGKQNIDKIVVQLLEIGELSNSFGNRTHIHSFPTQSLPFKVVLKAVAATGPPKGKLLTSLFQFSLVTSVCGPAQP